MPLEIRPFIHYFVYGKFTLDDFNKAKLDLDLEKTRQYFPDLQITYRTGADLPLDYLRDENFIIQLGNDELIAKTLEADGAFEFLGYLNSSNQQDLHFVNTDILVLSLWEKSISVVDLVSIRISDPQNFYTICENSLSYFFPNVMVYCSPASDSHPEENLYWFHTRGMIKVGLPELSVHNVPEAYINATMIIMEETAIKLYNMNQMGPIGDHLKIQLLTTQNDVINIELTLKGGLDDPAFNNYHFEMEIT